MYHCIYSFNSTLFYASNKNQIIFLYQWNKKKRIREVTASSVSSSHPVEIIHTPMYPVWMKSFCSSSFNKPVLSNPNFGESVSFYAIKDIFLHRATNKFHSLQPCVCLYMFLGSHSTLGTHYHTQEPGYSKVQSEVFRMWP